MMSKAKKRNREPKVQRQWDMHHLLWPRRKWNIGYVRELRSHWYMKVWMPKKTLHAQIHHEMAGIPVPTGAQARLALEKIRDLERRDLISPEDHAEKRLNILIDAFGSVAPETADALICQEQIVSKFFRSHARHS